MLFRSVYPPLDAATPNRNDGKPILQSPNSSIRWEMIREGIEDYEMLRMFEQKATAAEKEELKTLMESVSKSLTEFTTDPQPIRKARAFVANVIE